MRRLNPSNHRESAGDDPVLATFRVAPADGATASYKKAFLSCLIIWTTERSRQPRRRIIPWGIGSVLVLSVAYHWHAWSALTYLIR